MNAPRLRSRCVTIVGLEGLGKQCNIVYYPSGFAPLAIVGETVSFSSYSTTNLALMSGLRRSGCHDAKASPYKVVCRNVDCHHLVERSVEPVDKIRPTYVWQADKKGGSVGGSECATPGGMRGQSDAKGRSQWLHLSGRLWPRLCEMSEVHFALRTSFSIRRSDKRMVPTQHKNCVTRGH